MLADTWEMTHSMTGKTNTQAFHRHRVIHLINLDLSNLFTKAFSIVVSPVPWGPFPFVSNATATVTEIASCYTHNYNLSITSYCPQNKVQNPSWGLQGSCLPHCTLPLLSVLQPPWSFSVSTSPCFLQPQDICLCSSLWHLNTLHRPRHSFHLSAHLLLHQHTYVWHHVHTSWLLSQCNLHSLARLFKKGHFSLYTAGP